MFLAVEIAEAMGVTSPPTREQTASYWLFNPLQNTPGTAYAYSNFGYMLLGLIVKELTGMEPVTFLTSQTVTIDDWVPATEVVRGRSLKPDRYFRERGYTTSFECQNVFDPSGEDVPCPDGGFNLEGMAGHGNLVMSTTPILRYLDRYTVSGGNIGKPHNGSPPDAKHLGALDGTSSVAQQRSDGVHVVVLYNKRSQAIEYANQTAGSIYEGLDAFVTTWPTMAVDGFWVDFASAPSNIGAYDSPFSTMDDALFWTTDGAKLRLKPGSSGPWSGTISEKMLLDAPFGTAVIGE